VPAIFLVGGPDQSRSTLQMMTEKLAQAVATCLKTQPRAARVAKKTARFPCVSRLLRFYTPFGLLWRRVNFHSVAFVL